MYECNREANPGVCLCLAPDVDNLVDVLLEDRVQADDVAVEGLVELEVLMLRALHVHNIDRVMVRFSRCFQALVLVITVLVYEVDKRKVNCLSSSVTFEAAWYAW